MFDHVSIRVSDRSVSQPIYERLLGVLDVPLAHSGEHSALFGRYEFSIAEAADERPVTSGAHLGFSARSREAVDAFWQAGIDAGLTSDGEPGLRPEYKPDYYGGFLLDPDGNSIEAVTHGDAANRSLLIDHLWLRVPDVAAARDFYRLAGQHAGFSERATDEPNLAWFVADRGGSMTVIADERPVTTRLHFAFPGSRAQVDEFHAALTSAGHPSDGAPGQRPYHDEYYGAFVLDPAGHGVEVVNHGDFLARG